MKLYLRNICRSKHNTHSKFCVDIHTCSFYNSLDFKNLNVTNTFLRWWKPANFVGIKENRVTNYFCIFRVWRFGYGRRGKQLGEKAWRKRHEQVSVVTKFFISMKILTMNNDFENYSFRAFFTNE